MGTFRGGAAVQGPRRRILHRLWSAPVRLEERRYRLQNQRAPTRRVCADGGAGSFGRGLRQTGAYGRLRRVDEQAALAAGSDSVRRTSRKLRVPGAVVGWI